MASDRYGSARWAEAKDLKAEGVMTIPAARVVNGDGSAEEERAGRPCAAKLVAPPITLYL